MISYFIPLTSERNLKTTKPFQKPGKIGLPMRNISKNSVKINFKTDFLQWIHSGPEFTRIYVFIPPFPHLWTYTLL